MQAPAVVQLQSVDKTYPLDAVGVAALRHVDLEIRRGVFTVISGPSGSGKTTLLNLVGCIDRPDHGRLVVCGQAIDALDDDALSDFRARHLGFVFQNFNLLPRTSALDQVMMPLIYARPGVSESVGRERAEALLRLVGLEERMDHHPSQLSGGQQQRVAIARSLINNPPVLLADEPTGNLDSRTTVEILDMFRRLNAEEGITVILVTHDPGVARTAKRTIHMKDGLIEDAVPAPAA